MPLAPASRHRLCKSTPSQNKGLATWQSEGPVTWSDHQAFVQRAGYLAVEHAHPRILLMSRSPINLIKRPRIPKTAVPNLIHSSHSLQVPSLPLTLRSRHHALHCPPPHAILMVHVELHLLVPEELVRPPALTAQIRRSNLRARYML